MTKIIPINRNAKPHELEPSEFHVPSGDNMGEGALIHVRIPKMMAMELQIFLESRRFPYPTRSHMVRHGILLLLRWLHTADPTIRSNLNFFEAGLEIVQQQKMMSNHLGNLEALNATVQNLITLKMVPEARRTVLTYIRKVSNGKGAWRDKQIKEVKKTWGHLIQRSVSIKPSLAVDDE